jgi:reductive dehalogenase
MRLFSYRNRPVHLGRFPLERLSRAPVAPDLSRLPDPVGLSFDDPDRPLSLAHAMARFISMFDVIREGPVNERVAEIPPDPVARAEHLKAAAHYFDSAMTGICRIERHHRLASPITNPGVPALAAELETTQPGSFAAGIDMILADVIASARMTHQPITAHSHALVLLVDFPREPREGEPGADWIVGTQTQRAATLAAQTAVLLASYLRLLGYSARSHTATCSDVDLQRLAASAGLAWVAGEAGGTAHLINPFCGRRFALAAVTTAMDLAVDSPLAPLSLRDRVGALGPAWWLGVGTGTRAGRQDPFRDREFRLGPHPFERLKRRDEPTTFIDHDRVPRFPKRADFFARILFGDMGEAIQEEAKGAHYVMKSPIGACARRALGALLLLQFGDARGPVDPSATDPDRNADHLKAAAYYLSSDAVGLCEVPPWAWYSHDAGGRPIPPYHSNAINLLIDQGHETMEGASGDDWISVAQSMRAYLRFSMIGGIVAEQIRRLGFSARVHSVIDGDVLQPPLLLLSGLGEVSRIGEVILNPFLGPRLKSGTVTTNMPVRVDRPIDFGLQRFCEQCNKCARECPSGAITAGPKLMYNGYEIWKSDAEKCARYRVTNQAGGMCGRCMKTCPWNLEGLFAESGFRWLAMNLPQAAPVLAALDDGLGRGSINPVKKWWWDLELERGTGRYILARQVHARGLSRSLKLRAEDQTLAVYPADVMPPPYPVASPLDREAGIRRYRALLTPKAYRERLARGETEGLAPAFRMPEGPPPVFPVVLRRRSEMSSEMARYEFEDEHGQPLPPFEAGAHIDVVIAPEYRRSYSLAGDPADRGRYVLGVLREAQGKGGSALMHRAFREGRRVFVTPPVNHFPLVAGARRHLLFAGGIGVTPMIAMGHALHASGSEFELHYSAPHRERAAFVDDLVQVPWANRVSFHFSAEGARADLPQLIGTWTEGTHLYVCGSAPYMQAVFDAAVHQGWPETSLHREFFSAPAAPPRTSASFVLRLAKSGASIAVAADQSAAQALIESGVKIEIKCSDGICGVCSAPLISGDVDHRDYVLSAEQRRSTILLCCSRACDAGAEIVVDL